jgi:ArsR family transcriptional regulator, arsenate/arsenite/antimonite-responsive transcriptional repressor
MTSAAASLLALGDQNRLVLLRLLLESPLAVGDLMHFTGLGQSLVSHHLAVLARGGWVVARRQGRRRVYAPAVHGTPLAPLAAWIRREVPLPAAALGLPAPAVAAPARGAVALEDWLL